jgi:hypothetical protein
MSNRSLVANVCYRKRSNVFVFVSNLTRAQKLARGLASVVWVRVLGHYAQRVNPALRDLLAAMQYNQSIHTGRERAT